MKAKSKSNSRKELQNLVKENHELSKKLELATGKGASVGGASLNPPSFGGSTLTFDEAEDGFERVSMSPDRGKFPSSIHS